MQNTISRGIKNQKIEDQTEQSEANLFLFPRGFFFQKKKALFYYFFYYSKNKYDNEIKTIPSTT
jgi:hypothetical protein